MLAAAGSFPAWEAKPDVWLLIGLLVVGYLVATVRLGPRLSPAGQPVVSRFQMVSFGLGVVAVWVAADYPVDVIAEESLYSIHVVQHLLFALVAAPLLVLGTPGWLMRWILTPRWLFVTVRFLARFLPAVILYNLVLVITSWPTVVEITVENELAHFVGHAVVLVTALVVWLPVLSPLPEIPRLAPIGRMVFLFLESLVPTIPASFLTFGSTPSFFATTARLSYPGSGVTEQSKSYMKRGARLFSSLMVKLSPPVVSPMS